MSFLQAVAVFGGWAILAGLVACVVGAVLRFNVDDPPLLLRWADDRDRSRMVDEADRRLTLLVELNQMWNLPTREPQA